MYLLESSESSTLSEMSGFEGRIECGNVGVWMGLWLYNVLD